MMPIVNSYGSNYRVQLHVPCRNEEARLPRFLAALMNQTYESVQFIFHDNCSSDNTQEILQHFKSELCPVDFIAKSIGYRWADFLLSVRHLQPVDLA